MDLYCRWFRTRPCPFWERAASLSSKFSACLASRSCCCWAAARTAISAVKVASAAVRVASRCAAVSRSSSSPPRLPPDLSRRK